MNCLFTTNLTQKRKIWKDGVMHVTESEGKARIVIKDVRGDTVASSRGIGSDWKERADDSELRVGQVLVQSNDEVPEPPPPSQSRKRTGDKKFTPFVIRDMQVKCLDPVPQIKYRKTESALARLPDYNTNARDVEIFNSAFGISTACGDDFGNL